MIQHLQQKSIIILRMLREVLHLFLTTKIVLVMIQEKAQRKMVMIQEKAQRKMVMIQEKAQRKMVMI